MSQMNFLCRIGLALLIPLGSTAQEITVVAQAPPPTSAGGIATWVWVALGIWLVLGGSACICILTERSSTLKNILLALMLGPLSFISVIATNKDKIGLASGLAIFGVAMVVGSIFLAHGTDRDWNDAERLLSRAGNGTPIPISDVFRNHGSSRWDHAK